MFKNLLGKLFSNKQVDTPVSESIAYKGTPGIEMLKAKESPKQILSEDFSKHQWPISGGWGYSQQDAVVIELGNSIEGVNFEYKFLEYRTYEEAIIFRPKGQRLAGIHLETIGQSLVCGQDGKKYDNVEMKVSAFLESDFEYLKNDWEQHDGYAADEEGKLRHLQLAESKRIEYKITGWFDISRFFGKY